MTREEILNEIKNHISIDHHNGSRVDIKSLARSIEKKIETALAEQHIKAINETNEMKNNEEVKITRRQLVELYNIGCPDVKKYANILADGEIEKWVKEGDGVTLLECNKRAWDLQNDSISISCDNGSLLHKQLELQRDLLAVAYVLNDGWEADWNDSDEKKWYVNYATKHNCLNTDYINTWSRVGTVFFKSKEIIDRAIELVGGVDRWREAFGIEG